MSQELLNHKTKCRLCFQRVSVIRNCSRISEKIQQKFLSLTNIELKLSDSFSNAICKSCTKSLNESSEFQQKMIDNQQRLYAFEAADKFVVKIEPIELEAIELQEVEFENFLPKTEVFDVLLQSEGSKPTGTYAGLQVKSSPVVTFKRSRKNNPLKQLVNAVYAVTSEELSIAEAKQFDGPASTVKNRVRKSARNKNDLLRISQNRKRKKRRTTSNWSNKTDRLPNPDVEAEHSCDICGTVTHDKNSMKIHMNCHAGRYLNAPHRMKVRSYTKSDLDEALKILQNDPCKIHEVSMRCNVPVRALRLHLQRRQKLAMGENGIHKCSYCDKTYSHLISRKNHELVVHLTPAGEFPCDECGKVFSSKISLRTHVKNLHLIGIFKCYHCSEVFNKHKDMKNHKRIHQTDMACEICGKLVKSGIDYGKHVKSHSTQVVKCTFEGCSREFRRKSSLQYHIENSHTEKQDIKCPKCSSRFPNARRLKIHDVRAHSAARYYCEVDGCNHINKRKEYLKRHLKNHRDIDVKYRDELIAQL